jgi:glycosyltransferase involved in cell wall biosynthesis
VRLVAFTDYIYREAGGVIYGERAFALFLAALGDRVEQLTIVGRLDPEDGPCHYALPSSITFVPLPHYTSLTRPLSVAGSLARSLQRFWRALDDADGVWLLGPYPHAVAFAVLSRIRRRPLVLGVRQDFPRYVRSRRPTRRWMHLAADLLEFSWRWLARRSSVIVVGPDLARKYRHAPALLEITVSLISSADVDAGERAAAERSYADELTTLSVGRIDREKNPLLLAEILASANARDRRWHMTICGEGPLTDQLRARLQELGVAEQAQLRGYVAIDGGLLDLYRASHLFLHTSLTEGVPQVLLEAFASGVPVIATAVGGVAEAAGDAALLIPPSDAGAAVAALQRIAADPALRHRLISAGLTRAGAHTLELELARVTAFIEGAVDRTAAAPSAA